VFERVKQFGINTCQAGQALGIYLVGLALGGVDEPRPARIGHQHLVTTPLEHPANPWRMGPRLDGYAHRRLLLGGEASPESFGGRTQPAFLDHLTAFSVHKTEKAVFVP
jgi:hypothetical protein